MWQAVVYEKKLMPSLREALLYLAFPTHFLPIVNVAHKRAIRDAFAPGAAVAPAINSGAWSTPATAIAEK